MYRVCLCFICYKFILPMQPLSKRALDNYKTLLGIRQHYFYKAVQRKNLCTAKVLIIQTVLITYFFTRFQIITHFKEYLT